MIDIKKTFFDSLRIYFAPLVGAFKAVKAEMKILEQKRKRA